MSEQLVIACVKAGRIYHSCYANILYDMVRRNLSSDISFKFICFTDDPRELHPDIIANELPEGMTGWWNKLYMFKEGVFTAGERIIYFDLDTLITGNLDMLITYAGKFAILKDFYRDWGYGSAVMIWEGGTLHNVWSSFEKAGKPNYPGGDQAWMEVHIPRADTLQNLFPGKIVSYKMERNPMPAEEVAVVCFHGEPKQDNCPLSWVKDLWRIGAPPGLDRNAVYPDTKQVQKANLEHARSLKYPWLEKAPTQEKEIVVVGGGPSLNNCLDEIRRHKEQGHMIIAVNNSWKWLREHGIEFDSYVIFNADDDSLPTASKAKAYCAATSSQQVLAHAANIILFDPDEDGLLSLGSTAGLKALAIAFISGYRNIHLYGFDSCYDDLRNHHAYPQPGNDKDRIFTRRIYERDFSVATWMLTQAEEFVHLSKKLIAENCSLSVYGDGLIAFMAEEMQRLYLSRSGAAS